MLAELDKNLQEALMCNPPDFALAKELLAQGANINAQEERGDSIIRECLARCEGCLSACEDCDEKSCADCETLKNSGLVAIVDFFIQNGWDTVVYGLDVISSLVFIAPSQQMFYAARRILDCPLAEDREAYESALERIGTEESYQRYCEACHELENLYYVMYEMVNARMEGRDHRCFHPYRNAIGKCVDKIVYFANKIDFVETPRGIEYDLDFGFICGDEVIVIGPNVNVFFRNDLLDDQPQIDISSKFGNGIIGARIADISFAHASIKRDDSTYGQPTIMMKFDSGAELHFTHNFGENPDQPTQSRFRICAPSGQSA